jgi:hypothetical protein
MDEILSVLERYDIKPALLARDAIIPGSYWGESEAGLIGDTLYLRRDTPLHSVLHEACHFVCMNAERRVRLDRDAGGDHDEENGVCYLQILLADEFIGVGRAQMCRDMDAWGYTFRLGSARAWFDQDAGDAQRWLNAHGIIDGQGVVTWRKRS